MALYTIADLHLSTLDTTDKSMEVFGKRWDGYMDRIKSNWCHLVDERDTVVIPGDISWGLSLEEATSDLKFIDALPGKKILGKGNHDFWWSTMRKHNAHFEKHGITTISFLFNNAYETDDFVIAGTRGWFWDEDIPKSINNTDFDKLTAREELRLRTSLKAAKELSLASGKEIIVFMHFPPVWGDTVSDGLVRALDEFGVRRVYFGHIHGNYTLPDEFVYGNLRMRLVSADFINFTPKIVVKE